MMVCFYHEDPPGGSKRCKFLTSTLKDAFSNCHTFCGRLASSSRLGQESSLASEDDENEQEVFVSAVLSRYMEAKAKRKCNLTSDSFRWAFDPATGELSITQKATKQEEENGEVEEVEDFFSVCSCFSHCSSTSMEAFLSVKTNLSRCSSLSRVECLDFRKHSVILEFCHCEGWPFGLCRKALLLPPLPKSPSESWSWCKTNSARMVK